MTFSFTITNNADSFICHPFVSQENQNNDRENYPKVQVDGKLVGEINPDNFANESDFIPKIKKEIKQENSEEPPLPVTNVQFLDETTKSKVKKLDEAENDANKPQSEGSSTISNSGNAPIRHGPKEFGCPFCQKLMSSSKDMKVHIRTHTGEKPFTCNDCGKSFIQKSDLARHALIHTGEKPFQCNDCGKGFNRKDLLYLHRRIHTGEKPFECSDCGKRFNRKDVLDSHMIIHTGEKPFECSDCGKRFTHKSTLYQHKLGFHSEAQPVSCADCGKTFKNKFSLKKHFKKVHSNFVPNK